MADKKPNILLLMGDDIGWWNISYNNRGQMGYRTPNIDRIANEGIAFTDYYGQQSCTAGRAAFITGQNPVRTGLTKVGAPGAPLGLMAEDPTVADLLKPLGYATGQFGKNHFGDRNAYLPTVHGFDEFFGNLYHLNAEEEPENPDYPKDPKFRLTIGPRGVIHSWATDKDDPTEQPRWGRVGRQRIEDTGPLTKKRMETCDEEFTAAALDFIDRAHKADQPFFIWWNSTAMHCFTHRADKHDGKSGQGFYNDVMVAHDENVGKLLAKLDELGIADDTIVVYTTDNGPHYNTWPDAGITPFRSEKNTNWEGGWRVPAFVRWPGRFKAGTVLNDIICHQDWLPTLLAAAGEPDINAKLLKGHQAGDKDVQGPHRRLQHAAAFHRPGERGPAKVLRLCQRRRRHGGGADGRLEDRLRGTAGETDGLLGRAVRPSAPAEDLQPPEGPLREGRYGLQRLLELASRTHLRHRGSPSHGGPDAPELRGLPAAAEAGLLQPGRRAGADEGRRRRRTSLRRRRPGWRR